MAGTLIASFLINANVLAWPVTVVERTFVDVHTASALHQLKARPARAKERARLVGANLVAATVVTGALVDVNTCPPVGRVNAVTRVTPASWTILIQEAKMMTF